MEKWIAHSLAVQAARVLFPPSAKAIYAIFIWFFSLLVKGGRKEMEPDT